MGSKRKKTHTIKPKKPTSVKKDFPIFNDNSSVASSSSSKSKGKKRGRKQGRRGKKHHKSMLSIL